MEIYDGKSGEVSKTIARFNDVAYSGSLRSDGELVVAGGEEGLIRVPFFHTNPALNIAGFSIERAHHSPYF